MIDLVIKRGHTVIYTYEEQRIQSYFLTGNDWYIHLCLFTDNSHIHPYLLGTTHTVWLILYESYILNINDPYSHLCLYGTTHTFIYTHQKWLWQPSTINKNRSCSHLLNFRWNFLCVEFSNGKCKYPNILALRL